MHGFVAVFALSLGWEALAERIYEWLSVADLDTRALSMVQCEDISLSHRSGFRGHYHDKTKRGNVTEGHTRLSQTLST